MERSSGTNGFHKVAMFRNYKGELRGGLQQDGIRLWQAVRKSGGGNILDHVRSRIAETPEKLILTFKKVSYKINKDEFGLHKSLQRMFLLNTRISGPFSSYIDAFYFNSKKTEALNHSFILLPSSTKNIQCSFQTFLINKLITLHYIDETYTACRKNLLYSYISSANLYGLSFQGKL